MNIPVEYQSIEMVHFWCLASISSFTSEMFFNYPFRYIQAIFPSLIDRLGHIAQVRQSVIRLVLVDVINIDG
jgi:hypothetical protein